MHAKIIQESKNSKRITFEYVMLKDVNDSEAQARDLIKLISGIPSKINLIPFNPWPEQFMNVQIGIKLKNFLILLTEEAMLAP